MILINIVLTLSVSTACLSHDRDLHEIKVVYDHTCIASYGHLRVGDIGSEYGYWLSEGNECSAAGGFPSNPILSGPAPNTIYLIIQQEGGRSSVKHCITVTPTELIIYETILFLQILKQNTNFLHSRTISVHLLLYTRLKINTKVPRRNFCNTLKCLVLKYIKI